MKEGDVARGLEGLRRRERARACRVLHDEAGPALCSAGLMLGLMLREVERLGPEAREWLGGIQAALDGAMEAVRGLSYRMDPALARRCGLGPALEYLAHGAGVRLELGAGLPEWTEAQCEAACAIVGDILLAAPAGGLVVESSRGGLMVKGAGCGAAAEALEGCGREALKMIATRAGLELLYEVPIHIALISMGPTKVL